MASRDNLGTLVGDEKRGEVLIIAPSEFPSATVILVTQQICRFNAIQPLKRQVIDRFSSGTFNYSDLRWILGRLSAYPAPVLSRRFFVGFLCRDKDFPEQSHLNLLWQSKNKVSTVKIEIGLNFIQATKYLVNLNILRFFQLQKLTNIRNFLVKCRLNKTILNISIIIWLVNRSL